MPTAAANVRGALLVVVAMAAFCINDAFIQDPSTRAPIGQLIAVGEVFAVWGDVPSLRTLAGAALIMAAGLYIVWRERARSR